MVGCSFGCGSGKQEKRKRVEENNIKIRRRNLASGISVISAVKAFALKRMSAHSPGRRVKASMTVEACFVLPFFLFAFLNVISIVELYRLQGNMSLAMHETAKQMAVAGYEYKELEGDSDALFTYLYAAAKVRAKLGTDYLDSAPLANGAASISWLRSSVMCGDDIIDLAASYRIAPPTRWSDIRSVFCIAGCGQGRGQDTIMPAAAQVKWERMRSYISHRMGRYITGRERAATSNCRYWRWIWIFLTAEEIRTGKDTMHVRSAEALAEILFILQTMGTGITRHWDAASSCAPYWRFQSHRLAAEVHAANVADKSKRN